MSTHDTTSTDIDKQIYQIVDSFLVEAKNQYGEDRTLERLNADRHLAVEHLKALLAQEVLKATQTYRRTWIPKTEAAQQTAAARIEEHMNHVLPATEAAHLYEQNGEGSGIQYFDNERLARLQSLQTPPQGGNGQ